MPNNITPSKRSPHDDNKFTGNKSRNQSDNNPITATPAEWPNSQRTPGTQARSGRRTASGARYDRTAYSAAHRTLPLGTQVRVTDVRTGESVVVHINDRGPFARGRVIDLSRAAASEIGLTRKGVAAPLP